MRLVTSVSAKNESSPVGRGERFQFGVGAQRLSLMSAAAHGIVESLAISASIMVVVCDVPTVAVVSETTSFGEGAEVVRHDSRVPVPSLAMFR